MAFTPDHVDAMQSGGFQVVPFGASRRLNSRSLGLEVSKEFLDGCVYTCPYREVKFFGVLPIGYAFDGDIQTVRPEHLKGCTMWDMAFDWSWHKEYSWPEIDKNFSSRMYVERGNVGPVDMSFLGHGYTHGTLPSDGSTSLKLGLIPLSNGAKLLSLFWEWYNK